MATDEVMVKLEWNSPFGNPKRGGKVTVTSSTAPELQEAKDRGYTVFQTIFKNGVKVSGRHTHINRALETLIKCENGMLKVNSNE